MNHKLPVILAVAMAVAALSVFLSDRGFGEQVEAQEPIPAVEQTAPVIYEFNPPREEFKLDDGTPCVMVWAPQRAQAVSVVCDWDYKSRQNVN